MGSLSLKRHDSFQTNYAHLNWDSVNSVDKGATYRPGIVGHTTVGGRWEQPSSSMTPS